MEDCRVFGCKNQGVVCSGDVKMACCIVEDCGEEGVYVASERTPRSSWWTA